MIAFYINPMYQFSITELTCGQPKQRVCIHCWAKATSDVSKLTCLTTSVNPAMTSSPANNSPRMHGRCIFTQNIYVIGDIDRNTPPPPHPHTQNSRWYTAVLCIDPGRVQARVSANPSDGGFSTKVGKRTTVNRVPGANSSCLNGEKIACFCRVGN